MIGPVRWPTMPRRPRPPVEDTGFFEEDEDVESIKQAYASHNKGDLTSYEGLTSPPDDEKV